MAAYPTCRGYIISCTRGPGFLAVEWFGFFPLHSPYLSSRQQVVSRSQSSSVSTVELTNGRRRGGGRTLKAAGAKSYDGEKASSSIILSGHTVVCFTSSCLLPACFYFRIVMCTFAYLPFLSVCCMSVYLSLVSFLSARLSYLHASCLPACLFSVCSPFSLLHVCLLVSFLSACLLFL